MTDFVVSVVIDLPPEHRFHVATLSAIDDAAGALGRRVATKVVRSSDWAGELDGMGAGIVVGPGSPYDSERGVYEVIRSARDANLPLFGT